MKLGQALQAIADTSFYGDKDIIPNGDGTYSVEDGTTSQINDVMWTYESGLMELDNVDEHSRLMDHYEYFDHSAHIAHHLPESVEKLIAGTHRVVFAYLPVYDWEVINNSDLSDADDTAGWIIVADTYELEDN